jgi:hypothetical protein
MTTKLVILKTGENIITQIREMVIGGESPESEENKRVVGYIFNKACGIRIKSTKPSDVKGKTSLDVELYPWIPLTKTENIPVNLDWVLTIVDPVDSLLKMYEKDVLKNGKNEETEERPDVDFTESDSSDQSN